MGLFGGDEEIRLENADIDCEPQNDFVSKKTVNKIDSHLKPGEKVHYLAKDAGGGLEINDRDKVVGTKGYIRTVATDGRVLITVPNILNTETHVIPYENIASVSHSSGVVRNRLMIESSSKTYGVDIGNLADDACEDMTRFVRSKSNESKQGEHSSEKESSDPLEKIEQLKEMNDNRIISDEEFENKKKELLDDI